MGIGIKELLIILVVVLLVFGTKKLRTIGSDLGSAVKGFKKSMGEGESEEPKQLQASEQKDAEFNSTTGSTTNQKTDSKSDKS